MQSQDRLKAGQKHEIPKDELLHSTRFRSTEAEPSPVLDLNGFEAMMVLDERPRYPMTFCIDCTLRGRMDPLVAEVALDLAVRCHPLLRAGLVGSNRDLAWKAVENPGSGLKLEGTPGLGLETRKGENVRLFLDLQEDISHLVFEFHHAATDGLGGRDLIWDFLEAYDALHSQRPPQLLPRDPDLLRDRLRRPKKPKRSGRPTARPSLLRALRVAWKFVTHVPTRLVFHTAEERSERPPFLRHLFSKEESERLTRCARRRRCTVNDLGVALLFRTLAQWQYRNDRFSPHSNLRILVPTSLRDRSDQGLGAANRMAYAFFNQNQQAALGGLSQVLSGVKADKSFIRDFRPDVIFLRVIDGVYRMGLLKPFLRLPYPYSTAVLTNLGEVTPPGGCEVANLKLEAMGGTPPVRPGTGAAFALMKCDGKLSLSLRCDPNLCGADEERELLELYLYNWRALLSDRTTWPAPDEQPT